MKKTLAMMKLGLLCFSMFVMLIPRAVAQESEFQATYSTALPSIDGSVTDQEWGDSNGYDISLSGVISATVHFKHDGMRICIGLKVFADQHAFDQFLIYFDEGDDGSYGSGTRDGVLKSNQEDVKGCFSRSIDGYTTEDGCYKGGWEAYWGGDFEAACAFASDHWECEFSVPFSGNDGEVDDVSDLVCSITDTIGFKIQYFTQPGANNYFYPAGDQYQIETYTTLSFAPEAVNMCIIPVDTADQGIVHSEAYFTEIGEKLQSYFGEVSYGHLDVRVEICHEAAGNWVALTQTTAWYSTHTEDTFLQDAVDAADGLIDFTNYDYASQNGKGIVAIVPPTDIFGGGAFVWTHQSASSGAFTTDDNTNVDAIYVHEGRFRQAGQIIRGLAHEFGHALGKLLVTSVSGSSKDAEWVLPDLYLRGNVISRWCLMGKLENRYDLEHVHLSSYCKEWLGWLKYKNTYIGETHTLKSLATTGFAGNALRYSFEQGAHFYIMELRSNSTTISEWDNETLYQKAVSFYEVDVKTDPAQDTINLVKTLTETGSFSDPDAGAIFNVRSMTEENAEIAITKYRFKYFIGYVLRPFAIPWGNSLPYIPHEAMEQIPLPDTDLHAYTEDGKHVGMNYETGQYESEIPGALASGDLFNGREWIFVPEDVKVRFVADSHDTEQFLEAFPEAGNFTDGVETYSGKLVYYDPNEFRWESTPLTAQIEPGKIIHHSYAIIRKPDQTYTPVIDDTPPLLTIETPQVNAALQDGVTLKAYAWDENGVSSVTFSIREPNGEHGTPILPAYEYMPASLSTNDRWILPFDTTKLPDGYYVAYVESTDIACNKAHVVIQFSIRNWAPIELLPASEKNKAGRTMPVRFSIRVIASVDPNRPFIRNEELTIKIYIKGYPGTILQTSTYGTTSTDYRIDPVSEKYITNFKTISTPATYVVEIYRKDMLIGSFKFETVK